MSAWVQLVGHLADAPQHRAFAGGGRYWLFFVQTPRPTNPERTDTWTCTWTGDGADRIRELRPRQLVSVTGYLETYEKALGKQTVYLPAVRVLDARPFRLVAGNGVGADQREDKRGPKARPDRAPEPPAAATPQARAAPGRTGKEDTHREANEAQPPAQDDAGNPSDGLPEAIPMVKVDPAMFGLADDDEEDESRA